MQAVYDIVTTELLRLGILAELQGKDWYAVSADKLFFLVHHAYSVSYLEC